MPPIPRKPETGWICRERLDANAIYQGEKSRCEFCGTPIRWIHVLQHDDYHRTVEAGCCCAAHRCFDYDAKGAERELKNRTDRLMRFVDLQGWERSKNNPENICRPVQLPGGNRVQVTVFLKEGRYGICVADRKADERYFHRVKFASQSEALSVAFELVEELKEEKAEE